MTKIRNTVLITALFILSAATVIRAQEPASPLGGAQDEQQQKENEAAEKKANALL